MEKLSLKTQGVKGGNPTWKEDAGYVAAFVGNTENAIVIDCFDGYGPTYKRRKEIKIHILNGSQEFEFENFEAFISALEKGTNHL